MSEFIPRMHHVGLVVESIDASAAWYTEHFAFKFEYGYEFPGVKAAFLKRGEMRIELFQNVKATSMAVERSQTETNLRIGGINHFAIQVSSIDAAITELRTKGVEIVSPPRDVPNSGGDRFAFIHDNERMLVELFETAV